MVMERKGGEKQNNHIDSEEKQRDSKLTQGPSWSAQAVAASKEVLQSKAGVSVHVCGGTCVCVCVCGGACGKYHSRR